MLRGLTSATTASLVTQVEFGKFSVYRCQVAEPRLRLSPKPLVKNAKYNWCNKLENNLRQPSSMAINKQLERRPQSQCIAYYQPDSISMSWKKTTIARKSGQPQEGSLSIVSPR